MIPYTTITGRHVDLAAPRPEDVDVVDVACGLSKICRFGGQLPQFYSVAQHAVNVSKAVGALRPDLRLAALHHDDAEAYLGDMTSHLKHSLLMSNFRMIEDSWNEAVEEAFHIRINMDDRNFIKTADDVVTVWERVVFRWRWPWTTPERYLAEAYAEGWVKRLNLNDMMRIAAQLPERQSPYGCKPAEVMFLDAAGY